MGFVKKIILLLVLVIGLVVGIWFSTENTEVVTASLFGFELPAMTLGLLVCSAFALGTGLGYLVSLLPVLTLKNTNMSLRRKLKRRDQEIERYKKTKASAKG